MSGTDPLLPVPGSVDAGCECVGYQAHDPQGNEDPALTMNTLIQSVRFGGGLGVVGVFLPEDPGAPDEAARSGKVGLGWGLLWFKAQRVGTGQAPVKRYNRELAQLIHQGKANPSLLVSHEVPLEEAPDAYGHFDARDDGWTKVVLKPNGSR
jgi:glutathione-independent formaldehyde dehydrogenase